MSNTDSFIDEVAEEVRRERLFRLYRRYGWIVVLVIVAIVGAAAAYEWQKASRRADARAFGDAVLAALDAPDAPARRAALAGIAAGGPEQAALLALLASDAGVATGEDGDRAAALAALDAVAGDATLDPMWRDLAVLRRVSAAGEAMTADDRRAALQPLTAPGRPYRPLAQEQVALLDLAAGDHEAALAAFRALVDDQEATEALRRRAAQMVVVLGGEDDTGDNRG
ncbi:hypothetical protein [Ruixingdingia sedimenti]|uniref:Tetratricopeptide repeat-like domain-containing protein n=1 Tax=Ruixingdingia sedimenti TaxID=3073604 RepID=A0ABU1F3E2_9RHOB|nr:hypothetical protein [Xinfangfangia sp. LG-4]MDR5651372.1 hypothetical protein [Xinfangfangia sp. LG-4]